MPNQNGREELVDLANIEMIHKKRKHDKESRLATVIEGRTDREKFGSRKSKMDPFASTTNKEKMKSNKATLEKILVIDGDNIYFLIIIPETKSSIF